MKVLGKIVVDIPLVYRNMLSHTVLRLKISMITLTGFLNGIMLYVLWVLSFIVRMNRSIYGTCSYLKMATSSIFSVLIPSCRVVKTVEVVN